MSPAEPAVKRAVVFIDGQNLFHAAREAFGYTYPNYDVHALAQRLCAARGWQLEQTRFYTGIPDSADNALSASTGATTAGRTPRGREVVDRRPRGRRQTAAAPWVVLGLSRCV